MAITIPATRPIAQAWLTPGSGPNLPGGIPFTGGDIVIYHLTMPDPGNGSAHRTVQVECGIGGATPATPWDHIVAIDTLLIQAARAAERRQYSKAVTFSLNYGGANWVYLDVVGGTLDIVDYAFDTYAYGGILGSNQKGYGCILNLECLPWGRGDTYAFPVSGAITVGTGNPAVGAGTGNNGLIIQDVPGDGPALVQLNLTDNSGGSQVINRVRVGRRADDVIGASDYPTVVAMAATGAGTTVADSTAIGGAVARLASPTSTLQNVASAVVNLPAVSGNWDLWVHARDNAAVAGPPSGLTGAPTQPYVVQQQSGIFNTTTAKLPWINPTTAGNTAVMILVSTSGAPTTPTGWTAGPSNSYSGIYLYSYYIANIGVRTGYESISVSGSGEAVCMYLAEIGGVLAASFDVSASAAASILFNSPPNPMPTGTTGTTAQANELVIAAWAESGYLVGNGLSAPGGASYLLAEMNAKTGMVLNIYAEPTTSIGTQALSLTNTSGYTIPYVGIIFTLKAASNVIGKVPASVYSIAVVAVLATGALTITSTQTTVQLPSEGAIGLSWTAPPWGASPSSYRVYFFDGAWFYFDIGSTATSYNLTQLSGAIAGDPPIAPTPTASIGLRVGYSSGTVLHSILPVQTRVANDSYEWVYVAQRPLPPGGVEDGQSPRPIMVVADVASVQGATVDIDAFALLPAGYDDAYCEATYLDPITGLQTLATQAVWRLDSNRYMTQMTGLLLNKSTGDEQGDVKVKGRLTLGPGDNLLTILVDIAGGVADVVDSSLTVAGTITPSFRRLRGIT